MKRYAIYTCFYEVKADDYNKEEIWSCTPYADGTAPKLIKAFESLEEAQKYLDETVQPDTVYDRGRFYAVEQSWIEEEELIDDEWNPAGSAWGKTKEPEMR